jgi:hypothetical protein
MRLPVSLALASVAAAAALVPAASTAQPAGPPTRKAGWWEMTMAMSAPVPMRQKMSMCVDAASEKASGAFATMNQRGNCTTGPVTRTPSGWAFSSTCKQGSMTMTTSGVASGDFNSAYKVDSTTRMNPAPMPQMAESKMTIEAKWAGPCPAGRKPGDMVMANGMVMHMGGRK